MGSAASRSTTSGYAQPAPRLPPPIPDTSARIEPLGTRFPFPATIRPHTRGQDMPVVDESVEGSEHGSRSQTHEGSLRPCRARRPAPRRDGTRGGCRVPRSGLPERASRKDVLRMLKRDVGAHRYPRRDVAALREGWPPASRPGGSSRPGFR